MPSTVIACMRAMGTDLGGIELASGTRNAVQPALLETDARRSSQMRLDQVLCKTSNPGYTGASSTSTLVAKS
jgi:hypothetical protein